MSVNDEILEILAYHEAGHAVVAWSLSVPVVDIQIGTLHNKVHDGLKCRELDPMFMSKADWKCAERLALILLGGEMAERTFDNQATDFASETDRNDLYDLIEKLFGKGESGRKWLDRMEDEAEGIVIENWPRIRVLAEVLLERRLLTGAEVVEIIQG